MLLRWIGYGLLLLTLLDLIETFIPLNLMDAAWELQTIGTLVERVPVPLIGLGFVFLGEKEKRQRWELPLLRALSWLALLIGVLYLLLFPPGFVNAIRIDQQNRQQISAQVGRRMTQIRQFEERLDEAMTVADLEELLGRFDSRDRSFGADDSQQLDAIKEQLATSIAQERARITSQAEATRASQRLGLLKRSVKWSIGALVSGVLFIGIWRGTRWAR